MTEQDAWNARMLAAGARLDALKSRITELETQLAASELAKLMELADLYAAASQDVWKPSATNLRDVTLAEANELRDVLQRANADAEYFTVRSTTSRTRVSDNG